LSSILDRIVPVLSRLDELRLKVPSTLPVSKVKWTSYEPRLDAELTKLRPLRQSLQIVISSQISQVISMQLLEINREVSALTPSAVEKSQTMTTRSAYRTPHCSFTCACQCHTTVRVSMRPSVRTAFGNLYGTISRLPRPKCNESDCNVPGRFGLDLTVLFPAWMFHQPLGLQFQVNQFSSPISARLRALRVVDHGHASFKCAADGDVGLLRVFFETRESSPYDVDVNGDSLLHVSTLRSRSGRHRIKL
jgi:hypothetical protein